MPRLLIVLLAGFVFLANPSAGQVARLALITQGTLEFVNQASMSDRFEIEGGRLAQAKAAVVMIRGFAGQMIAAYSQIDEQLKTLAGPGSRLHLDVSQDLDESQRGMLAQLRAASGATFDAL